MPLPIPSSNIIAADGASSKQVLLVVLLLLLQWLSVLSLAATMPPSLVCVHWTLLRASCWWEPGGTMR